MNIELESINLINKKDDTVKENKNINKKENFQLIFCEESNKVNDKDNIDNEDITIQVEEDELNIETENDNYKYYSCIISNQYLKEDKILDEVSNKQIFFVNNKLFQNIKTNEEINDGTFEIVECKNLTDTIKVENVNLKIKDNEAFKDVYEMFYKVSSKEELNLDNMPNNKERIEDINEIDVLGKISMIKTDRFFEKSISEDIQQLQYLSKTDIEGKINDEAIKNIKFMKMEDIKELSVKLRPKELGDMHIKLLQENDTLRAIITVSDKDVYSIMNKNLSELKQHIEMFNVKEISIVVESENSYSSDSFDKSFEDNKRNEHNSNNRNTKRNNTQLNIEESIIYEKQDGINLLA